MTNLLPLPNPGMSGEPANDGPFDNSYQNAPAAQNPNMLPSPQNGKGIAAATQMSNGSIPVNVNTTHVLAQPGADSLLAQMSRGQVALKDSNYGQPGFAAPPPGAQQLMPVEQNSVTGDASNVAVLATTYTGN